MTKFTNISLLVASVALLGIGCRTTDKDVRQFGEMRAVLRDGRTESRIDLQEAIEHPHVYGVGALTDLAGEITILDGEVWVSRVAGDHLTVCGPEVVPTDRATLLTLSVVREWERIDLTQRLGGDNLETTIERLASELSINTDRPFPFVVEGKIVQLELHVIAGSCPLSSTAGATQPWRASIDQPVQATLVGFFAKGQGGIMTHHGSSVHMHAVMPRDGRTITAHVDHVVMDAGSMLRLPKHRISTGR